MHEIDLRQFDLNLLVTFDVLMDERSVTRAATRLGRTQSAVSHALSRLREQVGDPLLVKQNGRMTATPFAERMTADVRPILHGIRRALTFAPPFDPATTTRTFRVGMLNGVPASFPRLVAKVRREAPSASVDWVPESPQSPLAVADGQLDLGVAREDLPLPEGIGAEEIRLSPTWVTIARKGHPAIRRWGKAEWLRWPHVLVRIGNSLPSPVSDGASASEKRKIGARVPSFSDVARLVADTDFLATFPTITFHREIDHYRLQLLPPPFPIANPRHRFIWSKRLDNDPASRWIRRIAKEALAEIEAECAPYAKRVSRR